jgi:hypothetical protein
MGELGALSREFAGIRAAVKQFVASGAETEHRPGRYAWPDTIVAFRCAVGALLCHFAALFGWSSTHGEFYARNLGSSCCRC